MINIYPFKAVTPLKELEHLIHDDFVFYRDKKFCLKKGSHEQKLIYINNLLAQNLLHKHAAESFYCCKISNQYYSVIGVVALIKANLLGKSIFKHERCINSKEKNYSKLFKKHNLQISPIILVHEDNPTIDRNIDNLINQRTPFITIEDNTNKYEIWAIDDLNSCNGLYDTINCFLIADGHHRIAAANSLNIHNSFVTAFLTSIRYIKTADIYREYMMVDKLSKEKLRLFLRKNFNLIHINNINNLCANNFLVKIDLDLYKVKNLNNNDNLRRDILEFLDRSINYNNGTVNFYNYPFRGNKKFMENNTDVSLLIPAFNIGSRISYVELYPPHSTMFYPKLPEGLIVRIIS